MWPPPRFSPALQRPALTAWPAAASRLRGDSTPAMTSAQAKAWGSARRTVPHLAHTAGTGERLPKNGRASFRPLSVSEGPRASPAQLRADVPAQRSRTEDKPGATHTLGPTHALRPHPESRPCLSPSVWPRTPEAAGSSPHDLAPAVSSARPLAILCRVSSSCLYEAQLKRASSDRPPPHPPSPPYSAVFMSFALHGVPSEIIMLLVPLSDSFTALSSGAP